MLARLSALALVLVCAPRGALAQEAVHPPCMFGVCVEIAEGAPPAGTQVDYGTISAAADGGQAVEFRAGDYVLARFNSAEIQGSADINAADIQIGRYSVLTRLGSRNNVLLFTVFLDTDADGKVDSLSQTVWNTGTDAVQFYSMDAGELEPGMRADLRRDCDIYRVRIGPNLSRFSVLYGCTDLAEWDTPVPFPVTSSFITTIELANNYRGDDISTRVRRIGE